MNRIAEIPGTQCERELRSAVIPMLVHFRTSWSGQCQILAPSLEVLAGELGDQVKIAETNLDQCPELAGRFGIANVPTLILFDNGTPIGRFVGLTSARELTARLRGLLADYATPRAPSTPDCGQ